MKIARSFGQEVQSSDVADFFQVAESTVLRHYARYGGVKIGRRILFFEKLIDEAIRRTYAIQAGQEMDGSDSDRRAEGPETVRHQGRSKGVGDRAKRPYPAPRKEDPFGLTS